MPSLALSETLSPLLVALVLWMAYRFWRLPTWGNIGALGAAIGLAALGRDELALLWVFILLPLVLLVRSASWRRRIGLLLVGGALAGVVVLPWVGYNLSRFDKVVTVSDGFGPTLLSANCGTTYSGPIEGYWSWTCLKGIHPNFKEDESVKNAVDQSVAMKYIRAHEGDLPRVTLARIGRGLGLYHPMEQVRIDSVIETRPYHWWLTGLYVYYALVHPVDRRVVHPAPAQGPDLPLVGHRPRRAPRLRGELRTTPLPGDPGGFAQHPRRRPDRVALEPVAARATGEPGAVGRRVTSGDADGDPGVRLRRGLNGLVVRPLSRLSEP